MGKLDGRVAIIVGCATGIGVACAELVAREGAEVVLADINIQGAEKVADRIRKAGGDAAAYQMDISVESDVKAMVEFTIEKYGGVDILHNNAADFNPDTILVDRTHGPVDLDLAVWDRTMAVNLRGYLLCIRSVIPEMIKRGGGSIINTSSQCTILAEPVASAYASAKAGVNQLTRSVATAYGKSGIRCNAIAGGFFLTPENDMPENRPFFDLALRHHLTRRVGGPEDIAHMVVFLASEDAAYITGAIIPVDGGITTHVPYYAEVFNEAAHA